jgi:hypothetical protein
MADFDISFKIASHTSGREFCRLRGIQPDVWEPIGDTLQTTERLADRAFRAQQGGERFVIYFECYTTWREDARWNILAKSALLSEREQLPTCTFVFVLTEEGYRDQSGTFRLAARGQSTQQVWFEEICLWREQPQPWWETVPGLMALLPLTAHGLTEEDAVAQAARSINTQLPQTSQRADLLTALAYFGKLAYPALGILDLIGRENMRESKFFEEVISEGRMEGRIEGALATRRDDILEALTLRFGSETADEFKEALNAITDQNKLLELYRLAIKSRGAGAIRRVLRSLQS